MEQVHGIWFIWEGPAGIERPNSSSSTVIPSIVALFVAYKYMKSTMEDQVQRTLAHLRSQSSDIAKNVFLQVSD